MVPCLARQAAAEVAARTQAAQAQADHEMRDQDAQLGARGVIGVAGKPGHRRDEGFARRQGFGGDHHEFRLRRRMGQLVQVFLAQGFEDMQEATPHLVLVQQVERGGDGRRVFRLDRTDDHFPAIG